MPPASSPSDPLFVLAIVLLCGVGAGALARRVRLPGITGQILAGIVIGHGGLDLFAEESFRGITPVTHFALGLMAVTVGSHLNFGRLRNAGKRLGVLLLLEVLLTPALVVGGLLTLPGVGLPMALLLGAIAVETAPATIISLIRESRARGVFVKTLMAAVALNNMACIVLFELARSSARGMWSGPSGSTLVDDLAAPALQLGGAMVLGGGTALALHVFTTFAGRGSAGATGALSAILLTVGGAAYLNVSPLLACLVLGVVQTNMAPARERQIDRIFGDFEQAIMAVFFTLAGAHIDFRHAALAGAVAVAFFALRACGKFAAVRVAMRLAAATEALRKNLGLALLPQAGLAIGLVLLVSEDPVMRERPEALSLFVAVVLSTVMMNELVGPILARIGIARSGDAGKDRMRLIDFIDEEHIVVDLDASEPRDAIARLTDLLVSTHSLAPSARESFLASVHDREAQLSTCLGGGLAIPHGILPPGAGMIGAMGINRRGLPFSTPDGEPVHCIVLLGTAPDERDRHLQVLAALARVVGTDPARRAALFAADTPAHAYEVLHGGEAEGFNYFLEE